jgi:uncharacterized damage-inducible protein DinB
MPSISELLVPEIEREAAHTRRVLERVPDGRGTWKPHEKSMELGYLAALCATMIGWIHGMVTADNMDIGQGGGGGHKQPGTAAELVAALDESVARTVDALRGASDEHLQKPWQLLVNGHVVQEQPRYQMIREGVINHLAHHRGQLTVYLRLNDALVPSIYGPSADERPF